MAKMLAFDFDARTTLLFKIDPTTTPSERRTFQARKPGWRILRDIFTMGARPIALLNSLRFGSLEDARTRRIFNGVVAGISHYGNCVGVPTVGGEVYFDPAYTGNPLVNVMALGLMETQEIVKSGASASATLCYMSVLRRVGMAWAGQVLPVPN
jgi:phosphoribosylformylglycinamidine synthase